MPIRNSHDDLPSAVSEGVRPVELDDMIVAPTVIAHWHSTWLAAHGERPKAIEGTMFRASDASRRCDRALFYAMADEPKSEPLTAAASWRLRVGQMVHDEFDEAMKATLVAQGWDVETAVDLRPLGINGSAHADASRLTDHPDYGKVFVEVKSQSGFKYKDRCTSFKGAPKGPEYDHVVQGALAAAAQDADLLIVLYLALETVSPGMVDKLGVGDIGRFAAEFHFDMRSEAMTTLLAHELGRIRRLERDVIAKRVPARSLDAPGEIPSGATMVDPMRNAWTLVNPATAKVVQAGKTWFCDYCPWRTTCMDEGE